MRPVIAFDFDGTLLDSRMRHIVVMSDVLARNNIKLDVAELVEYKRTGKSNVNFLLSQGIKPEIAIDLQNQWINDIENIKYLSLDCLYEDAIDLLEQHFSKDELILITARSNKSGLLYQLNKFNLQKYFRDVYIVNPGKTASLEKSKILSDNNVSLMYGDTNSDYMAAQIAKVKFVIRENGFHNKETILGTYSDIKV